MPSGTEQEAEVLQNETPGPTSSSPLSSSFLSSPEDLISGFEAAETPSVQLSLAATSGYGKDAGNSIPGPGNSRCTGSKAGALVSMVGGQPGG